MVASYTTMKHRREDKAVRKEHQLRIQAKLELAAAHAKFKYERTDENNSVVTHAVHKLYHVMGQYPLSREDELAQMPTKYMFQNYPFAQGPWVNDEQ